MNKKTLKIFTIIIGLIVLGIALAGISNGSLNFNGWIGFSIVLLLCSIITFISWKSLKNESPPNNVLVGIIIAISFRLLLGILWSITLPIFGYETEVNQAGYIMSDAYHRDNAAWELANSDNYLLEAFHDYSNTDQYGGLLFLSGLIYRTFGGSVHQPLLIITISSTISGLAAIYVWGISNTLWNKTIAKWAFWLIVFYPELAMLGSSQMREAFTPTLILISGYYFIKWLETKKPFQLIITIISSILLLGFSNPTFILSIIMLFILYLVKTEFEIFKTKWFWLLIIISIIILIFSGIVFTDFIKHWMEASQWEKYLAQNSSGWVQRQFRRMPSWSHVPFVVFYGIFRPLLPSAIVASGLPIWKIIGIWRALGWTITLLLLLYATFLSIRYISKDKKALILSISQWLIIIIASYRGGGDQWDSPRYRAIFAGYQIILIAWAIYMYKKEKDPWLKRTFIAAFIMIIWFIPWYLRRYFEIPFHWDLVDLPDAIGVPIILILMFWLVDWFLSIYQANRTSK